MKTVFAALMLTAMTGGAMAQTAPATGSTPTADSGAAAKGVPDTSAAKPPVGETPAPNAPQSPASKADSAGAETPKK